MFELEPGQVEPNGYDENTNGTSYPFINPATPPPQTEGFASPRFEPTASSFAKKRKIKDESQDSQEKDTTPSVANCYVFKSRLQEYCQKAGVQTPTYHTIKEGPSHEPYFRSTVTVNDIRYDSLPRFFNRKAAEQSAAEVALIEIANSVDMKIGMSQHVHETGLCKNLLQEYTQKMNYAIPLYECHKEEKPGGMPMYSCTVEIGGIKYIGASTNTKKEAEIKAARTALIAIQSAGSISGDPAANSIYTVVPQKKKASSLSDLGISTQESAAALKPKKGRFKNNNRNRRRPFKKGFRGPRVNGDEAGGSRVRTPGDSDISKDVRDGLSADNIVGSEMGTRFYNGNVGHDDTGPVNNT